LHLLQFNYELRKLNVVSFLFRYGFLFVYIVVLFKSARPDTITLLTQIIILYVVVSLFITYIIQEFKPVLIKLIGLIRLLALVEGLDDDTWVFLRKLYGFVNQTN